MKNEYILKHAEDFNAVNKERENPRLYLFGILTSVRKNHFLISNVADIGTKISLIILFIVKFGFGMIITELVLIKNLRCSCKFDIAKYKSILHTNVFNLQTDN